jgi:spermidine synthase
MLSLSLGTEMMAVLGVVAGFFGGLALGALVLDQPIRRVRSPRMAYAVLEAAIGLWAVISVWLLPAAGRALPPLLGTEPAPALLWAAGFGLPALVLLPATAAMGGTLTALERMVAAAGAGTRVSAGIYGANTAGAVVGTLAAVFLLLPGLGLSGTLLALAALNAICGLGALAFGPSAAVVPTGKTAPASADTGQIRLSVTLFATGLLGIAFEMLVVRLAAEVMQDTIYTFAGLLAAYLLGTAAGGLAWQRVGRAFPGAGPGWVIGGTALVCLSTTALIPFVASIAETASGAGIAGELGIAAALFLLPSAGMGALFGSLAQAVRDRRGSLGWAVGINGIGAALGPLLAALVLIPALGAWTGLLAVSAGYLLLLPLRRASLIWFATPALVGVVLWSRPVPSMVRLPPGDILLATREGPSATASVVEDAAGARYLDVNGHFRMGGTNSVRSDWRQAMLPLLLHPAPHDALFLGVGTGTTLTGGARLPGVTVQGVELSPEVAALLPWFAEPGAAATRPKVIVADARRFVAAEKTTYDVIFADLFHPALDGTGALYTSEHFAVVRDRLAPGGLFCQWLPLFQLDLPSLRAIIRGFLTVYPEGSAWLAHYSVRTPMLALVGGREGVRVDPRLLAARLNDPAARDAVRRVGLDDPMEVLGLYFGGPRALAAFAGEGPRNTDDFPFVALDASRNVRALTANPGVMLTSVLAGLRADPRSVLSGPDQDALAPRLLAYWRARDRFIEAGAALRGEPRGRALVDAAAPGLLETIRLSAEFEAAYGPLISMAQSLLPSDRDAGIKLLQAIDEAAPSRGDARAALARVLTR